LLLLILALNVIRVFTSYTFVYELRSDKKNCKKIFSYHQNLKLKDSNYQLQIFFLICSSGKVNYTGWDINFNLESLKKSNLVSSIATIIDSVLTLIRIT